MPAKRLDECNGCEFRPELYYDDQYQIWVRPEAGGLLSIGMTDLSQAIAGKILHVRVRKPGTARPSGKPVATIESGKWAGPVPNVFDCVIVDANPDVLDNPGLLNDAPYDAWIARVRPQAGIAEALSHLLIGSAAKTGYCERAGREEIYCTRGEGISE
ncbi:MAG: glycine cleavage system protein H [Betaproteobacteria bacterium]|nr:glycine cleavage system protein H [Betaproteobacteria bacterium]